MANKKNHKLIFEGSELAGKSFTIHQVYDFLEKKYNEQGPILDGCHWINSDINIFGTRFGKGAIDIYIQMAQLLKDRNVIFEKFHISDQVYNEFYNNISINYAVEEDQLAKLGTKIILCYIKPDPNIFKERLENRLTNSISYGRMIKDLSTYIHIQEKYFEQCEKSKLPVLKVDLTTLPNPDAVKKILDWIGEI